MAAFVLEAPGELGRRGGLAGALQPDHEDAERRSFGPGQSRGLLAECADQLLVDDLYDLLARVQAGVDLFTHRPFPDPGEQVLGDVEVDICFEQSQPHLA